MSIAEEAFKGLFPDKEPEHSMRIIYSGKFSDYNANVRWSRRPGRNFMEFNLSRKWVNVSDEIQIGLIQSLMLKIFKAKKQTINIDLYNKFLRNVHVSAPKTEADPVLDNAFNRINEKFFNGMMDKTNLAWNMSGNVLGRYEYGSDTISISKVLEHDYELIDYVMYHEMLHKKHKFKSKNGRNTHHSTQFREDEKAYPHSEAMEMRLKRVVSQFKTVSGLKKSILSRLF